MTGMGTQIVRIVAERRQADIATIARVMGVSAGYVSPRVQRLAEYGYLKDVGNGVYAVKEKAKKAIFPFAGRGRGRPEPVANYP